MVQSENAMLHKAVKQLEAERTEARAETLVRALLDYQAGLLADTIAATLVASLQAATVTGVRNLSLSEATELS